MQHILIITEGRGAPGIDEAFAAHEGTFSIVYSPSISNGISLLASRPFALVILRLVDNEEALLEFCRRARKYYDTPSVLLTAHGSESLAVKALKSGVMDYIVETEASIRRLPESVNHVLEEWSRKALRRDRAHRLELTEEKHRIIFQKGRDAVFLAGSDARLDDVNEAAVELTGYTRAELLTMSIPDLHAEEDLGPFRDCFQRILAGENTDAVAWLLRKDGTKVCAEFSNSRMILDGRVYMHTTAKDVTQRVSQHKLLQESEESFNQVFETSPDAFTISTLSGVITRVSQSFCDLTGYSREEVIGNSGPDLGLWPNPEQRKVVMEKLTRNKVVRNQECNFRVKNGNITPALVSASLMEIQGQTHVLIIARDLSKEKRFEAESRLLHKAITQAGEAIFVCDTGGVVLYANPAADNSDCAIRAAMVIGKPDDWEKHGGGMDHFDAMRARIIKGRIWQGHWKSTGPSGRLRWEAVSVAPVRIADGHPNHLVCVQRDITRRKRMERKLNQANKMEAIGALAGGIAHDFNNILAAIMGYAEVCLQEQQQGAAADVEENLCQILLAANRGADLISQILAFSRKNSDLSETMELAPLVKEAIKLLRATIPAGQDIRSEICSDTMAIKTEPANIYQLIMNLSTNAVHAMQERKGRLSIKLESVELPQTASPKGNKLAPGSYAKLEVGDEGCGIEPAIRGRIFDPFFTTKEPGQGTGMGLSVVMGIVKSLGGSLELESSPNKGSVFAVYLPLERANLESEPAKPAVKSFGQGRILFVDDEVMLGEIAARVMGRMGFEVDVCLSPKDALSRFKENQGNYRLLVTDLNMPDMNGLDMAEKLRETKPDLKMILCSGYSEQVDEEKARAIGFSAMVSKPLASVELANLIKRTLAD